MNRNYWVRPIRHSRSGFDYGRTRLANDNGVSWRRLLGEALLLGTGIVGVVLALVAMGD